MFGKDLKLSIKKVVLLEKTILDRVVELIHKVPIFRESAKVTINRAQQKIRANYQIQQTKKFTIEDQVLYVDSSNYHEKLESK